MSPMSDVLPHESASSAGDVHLKRWEFYALVADAFLFIVAASVAFGLFRHRPGVLARVVFASGGILLVPLALLPVISATARFRRSRIDVVWMLLCAVLAAIVAGLVAAAAP